MSNTKKSISDIVSVKVGDADVSDGAINTDALGPCLCLLLDFMQGGKRKCFLHHYDSEMRDTDVPLPKLLQEYLTMICRNLKDCLSIKSIIPISEKEPGISDARLLVAGGDIGERTAAKDAFSLLNQNDVMFKPTSDADLLYLYRQLAHRTIVFESVSKSLPDDEESDG